MRAKIMSCCKDFEELARRAVIKMDVTGYWILRDCPTLPILRRCPWCGTPLQGALTIEDPWPEELFRNLAQDIMINLQERVRILEQDQKKIEELRAQV